jgi:hypothetical protein
MKSILSIFLVLFMGLFAHLSAQEQEPCASPRLYQIDFQTLWQSTPKPIEVREEDYQVTIPVVFHILYTQEDENISDAQLALLLESLNQDFSASNGDIDRVPSIFSDFIGRSKIGFCLAQKDPSGQERIGIVRKEVLRSPGLRTSSVDGRFALFYDFLGGSNPWDVKRYLNVYIYDLTGEGVLGFGFPPGTRFFDTEDGVAIDTREALYGIREGDRVVLGRTLTHEVGHYLGLEHLWGVSFSGGCERDDGIEDTPNQEGPYFKCQEGIQSSCGSPDMHMNFMDYGNDQCLHFFTKGQVHRMVEVIKTFRPNLGKDQHCSQPFPWTEEPWKVYPNPFTSQIQLHWAEAESIDCKILIYNSLGQIVYDRTHRTEGYLTLFLEHLPSGVYWVHASVDSKFLSKKILKF